VTLAAELLALMAQQNLRLVAVVQTDAGQLHAVRLDPGDGPPG
jgi:hypothetical protein